MIIRMGLTKKQWMMLVVIVIGTFVTILNQTLVTPALPAIMAEMSIDAATGQWLTTGFTLVNAIMIPLPPTFRTASRYAASSSSP